MSLPTKRNFCSHSHRLTCHPTPPQRQLAYRQADAWEQLVEAQLVGAEGEEVGVPQQAVRVRCRVGGGRVGGRTQGAERIRERSVGSTNKQLVHAPAPAPAALLAGGTPGPKRSSLVLPRTQKTTETNLQTRSAWRGLGQRF